MILGGSVCSCGQPLACDGHWTTFVGFSDNVRSEVDCQHFCSQRGRCKYYTWFNELDTDFKFYCFLYSDCIIEDTACVGCRSGPDTCFSEAQNWEQFTTTTVPTTSLELGEVIHPWKRMTIVEKEGVKPATASHPPPWNVLLEFLKCKRD